MLALIGGFAGATLLIQKTDEMVGIKSVYTETEQTMAQVDQTLAETTVTKEGSIHAGNDDSPIP